MPLALRDVLHLHDELALAARAAERCHADLHPHVGAALLRTQTPLPLTRHRSRRTSAARARSSPAGDCSGARGCRSGRARAARSCEKPVSSQKAGFDIVDPAHEPVLSPRRAPCRSARVANAELKRCCAMPRSCAATSAAACARLRGGQQPRVLERLCDAVRELAREPEILVIEAPGLARATRGTSARACVPTARRGTIMTDVGVSAASWSRRSGHAAAIRSNSSGGTGSSRTSLPATSAGWLRASAASANGMRESTRRTRSPTAGSTAATSMSSVPPDSRSTVHDRAQVGELGHDEPRDRRDDVRRLQRAVEHTRCLRQHARAALVSLERAARLPLGRDVAHDRHDADDLARGDTYRRSARGEHERRCRRGAGALPRARRSRPRAHGASAPCARRGRAPTRRSRSPRGRPSRRPGSGRARPQPRCMR